MSRPHSADRIRLTRGSGHYSFPPKQADDLMPLIESGRLLLPVD